MTICDFADDGGTSLPGQPCDRKSKYLMFHPTESADEPMASCDWHVLQMAYESGWTVFTVKDIRTEAEEEQDAADYAAALQEEQATEGDPF